MFEITKENFEESYSQLIDDIRSSDFIAIDCEFSGIFNENISLFDTIEDRYNKIRRKINDYSIIQFGLSTFHCDRINNKFNSSSYSFFLTPSPLCNKNAKITCQIGSIKFLCKHNFNFNKLFCSGINYINEKDEREIIKHITAGTLTYEHYSESIQEHCSMIADWSANVTEGSDLVMNLKEEPQEYAYLLHKEIRKKIPNVWTYCGKPGVITARKVSPLVKKDLLAKKEEEIILYKNLVNSVLGFSKIMKELKGYKKPIIGHNFFLDLMMIYKQFYNDLPTNYKKFKKEITLLFPNVFDTKYMSYRLRSIIPVNDVWNSNSLPDLYFYFHRGKGANTVLYMPLVEHGFENLMKANFHEGSFDSYCTGFCFIKMSYFFSLWNKEKQLFNSTSMPLTMTLLLGAVDVLKNKVNMARSQIRYTSLDGPDPKTRNMTVLYIESKHKKPLNVAEFSKHLAKYSSVDIKPLSKYKGLIAVLNHKYAMEIIQDFTGSNEYYVAKYNIFKHSAWGEAVIASGAIVSTILILVLCRNKIHFKSNGPI